MIPNVKSRLYDLFDSPKTHLAYNRTGATLAKGSIVAFDLTGSESEVTAIGSFVEGTTADTAHVFANVIDPATAHLSGWIFAVAKEEVADNALGEFVIQGVCDVLFAASGTSNVQPGNKLGLVNAQNYAIIQAAGNVSVGIALEASDASAALKKAIFNGLVFSADTNT